MDELAMFMMKRGTPDLPSSMLSSYSGGTCEHCGGKTIDRCLICGAPTCCPACCLAQQREEMEAKAKG